MARILLLPTRSPRGALCSDHTFREVGLTGVLGSRIFHYKPVAPPEAGHDKGKPLARGGRKATGPMRTAGLPNGTQTTRAVAVQRGRSQWGARR